MGLAIETKNLTKYYGKVRGIENINLAVEEGEIFGFIGPNGAGKSTTIRTLLSLIYKTSGSASIFGMDIVTDRVQILQRVGYLPSEVFYYEKMKVMDLLKYSASFYHKNCAKRIAELAELLELDLHRKIDDLSYGNRKKVGIIQGLLHTPDLIIPDEPTGGLDPLIQSRFFQLIKDENKRGATVLFSSHILSEVQNSCDRVAIIKDGNIIRVEKISVLRENAYKRVSVQADGIPEGYFDNIGAAGETRQENTVNFLFSGNLNLLTEKIANIENLRNISIEEPSLEELFMHYYR
jgi:ABC-2 type transport system ATP-binding protein